MRRLHTWLTPAEFVASLALACVLAGLLAGRCAPQYAVVPVPSGNQPALKYDEWTGIVSWCDSASTGGMAVEIREKYGASIWVDSINCCVLQGGFWYLTRGGRAWGAPLNTANYQVIVHEGDR